MNEHIVLAKSTASEEKNKDISITTHSVLQNLLQMIKDGHRIDDETLFILASIIENGHWLFLIYQFWFQEMYLDCRGLVKSKTHVKRHSS